MSGICGIVRFDGQAVKKEEIQNMLDAMQNRGNDTEGIWIDGGIGFGHKMLWTTPESLHENQPFISNEGNLVLTADARIDNRNQLFEQLEINKNDFDVITDIDLILWSYQKWGEECVKKIIGDFSFAIWDMEKNQLFCVRDHIGIKPFYYYIFDQYFVFSSEITSLFTLEKVPKYPDTTIILQFLEKIALEHSRTFFKKILRLPPANYLSLSDNQFNIERYWFPELINENKTIPFKEAKEKFYQLFKQAVKSRLRSAYPIGCELSGGLDSSSVYSIACDVLGTEKVLSFSKRYKNMDCDEGEYIEAIEKHLNSYSNIIWSDKLDYKNKYSLKRFNQEYSGWPGNGLFLDSLATQEKIQENGIRIMLTGQGGDHVLAGSMYMLADYMKSFQFLRLFREIKINNLSKNEIKEYIIKPLVGEKWINFIKYLLGKPKINKERYYISHLKLSEEMEEKAQNISFAQRELIGSVSGMLNAQWVDNNPSQLDGRYNIESRHPFFDSRLIEYLLSLPPDYMLHNGQTKFILREALYGKLPERIYQRDDKAEFSEALIQHMEAINLEEFWSQHKMVEFGILTKREVQTLLNQYNLNKKNLVAYFWRLVLVESWFRQNFDD